MLSLGLNYRTHDSAACIALDGAVEFAVAEERLSRIKHDGAFPHRAIRACLDHVGARPGDLDHVAFGWQHPGASWRRDLVDFAAGRHPASRHEVVSSSALFLRLAKEQGGSRIFLRDFGMGRTPPRFVDHHRAHAISAYAYGGMAEATVVVIDGRGAWEATSIWHGRKGRLKHVRTIRWPNSLGLFYAAFTQYLGFRPYSDEWKVMGLAPYGGPGVDVGPFLRVGETDYAADSRALIGRGGGDVRALAMAYGPARRPGEPLEQRHKDVAWAVQDACERAMLAVVRGAVAATGCPNLCLAGGVALNSKANGKILRSGAVERLFIQPAAGDDGVALGAALAPHMDGFGKLPVTELKNAYWGPAYDDAAVAAELATYKLPHRRPDDIAEAAAELLAAGKVVGWFQGRAEFGPRALGNRSILADPRDAAARDRVNEAVKFREPWRPFAPAILAEQAGDWVAHAADSPFMILTFDVLPHRRDDIAAVTHVDGSARVQTVNGGANPAYRRLIEAFARRTGVPMVLNTSFNLKGEPMVTSPTDAVRTFFSSGMDGLAIGPYLVEKGTG